MVKKALRQSAAGVILALLLVGQAFALHVPISQSEVMVDGVQTLTQVFEVPPDTEPAELVQENLEQNGYHYDLISITKDTDTEGTEKEITQTVEIPLSSKSEGAAQEEAVKSMKPSIEYNEDGFEGVLYINPGSMKLTPINERTVHGTQTVTKQYSSDYNDNSIIPKSVTEGKANYSLSSVKWVENDPESDSSVPAAYTATAVFSRSTSSVVNDGYRATVEYVGTVGNAEPETVKYTLIYHGYPIIYKEPSFWDRLFGRTEAEKIIDRTGEYETISPFNGFLQGLGTVVIWILIIAIFAALVLLASKLVKKVLNCIVTIYSRDEESGEESKMQKIFLRNRKPEINIDYLKAPGSRHFRIVLKPRKAESLLGKQITIQLGKKIIKHRVAQTYGKDYEIHVDTE